MKRARKGFNVETKLIVLDEITADFLHNIRAIRKNLGFTQHEIASYANTTRASITAYEHGIAHPELGILIKLAEILEVDISQSVNYKFFHGKIKKHKLKEAIRDYGLSLPEIASLTGFHERTVSEALRLRPNASLQCLNAVIELIRQEQSSYAFRQTLTRKKGA